jgi:hypothetical protein
VFGAVLRIPIHQNVILLAIRLMLELEFILKTTQLILTHRTVIFQVTMPIQEEVLCLFKDFHCIQAHNIARFIIIQLILLLEL